MAGFAAMNSNQRDYFMAEERDLKPGKQMNYAEDRLDSGLDSLKEDEYQKILSEMEDMTMEPHRERPSEPWKTQITEDGDTLLHLAVIHEEKGCALQIIERLRADPYLNIQNNQRQTPLHLAVITDQAEIVASLLKAGCDPLLVDHSGNTALHIACSKGSQNCFGALTQFSGKHLSSLISAVNYNGHTSLHLATLFGFLHLVEDLVKLGADVNAQEQCNGRTSLHLAVDMQNYQLVSLLISNGANVNSVTYGGYSPYHLTHGRQNQDIQQLLFQLTRPDLRDLTSDSEDSDDSELEEESYSESDEMYDDIHLAGC
ncbi:nuclear factor of kappa light polypeptide gene enhancer in B-cells inhibitor, alpha b [Erpetoichthys calabaricus]|uniref:NF-kappa-B inhibitor alpha n=1 Tax=Erpetoichthys calabaricus TaxID=27687 RepID=A0A8C4SR53_ERPCA|nr:nuclear factor of kappa light polypeptide gene enhancer in B-cells inhibitor, alpha b [Erpetoichthys calabaricus]